MNKKVQDVEKPSSFVKLPSSANFVGFFLQLLSPENSSSKHFKSFPVFSDGMDRALKLWAWTDTEPVLGSSLGPSQKVQALQKKGEPEGRAGFRHGLITNQSFRIKRKYLNELKMEN